MGTAKVEGCWHQGRELDINAVVNQKQQKVVASSQLA